MSIEKRVMESLQKDRFNNYATELIMKMETKRKRCYHCDKCRQCRELDTGVWVCSECGEDVQQDGSSRNPA